VPGPLIVRCPSIAKQLAVVDFPLRGEWTVERTPAERIPSHGTDAFGQRYAYDLIRTDERPGVHVHPAGTVRWLLIGGRARDCFDQRGEVLLGDWTTEHLLGAARLGHEDPLRPGQTSRTPIGAPALGVSSRPAMSGGSA